MDLPFLNPEVVRTNNGKVEASLRRLLRLLSRDA